MTARADEPTLFATSTEILGRLAGDEDRRLVWLSQHHYAPIPEARPRARRVLVTLALIAGIGVMLAGAVSRSLEYHPVYIERIRALKQRIEQARQKGAPQDAQRDED